jgi:hypothetical protein
MAKWFIAILFLISFPFAAFAQNDAAVMQTWVSQNFGINIPFGIKIPDPEIKQDWKALPVVNGCNYEWSVQWNDAKFQIKDGNDNHYRVSYQDNTLTVDFIRDFNGFFGG